MGFFPLLILGLYCISRLFGYWIEYLNIRQTNRHSGKIPPEFDGIVDAELTSRTRSYLVERTRLAIISSVVVTLLTIVFIFGGLLETYNAWVFSMGLPFLVSGWLFFMFLFFAAELVSVPFNLYSVFAIENRFGFNTMTPRLWFKDFVKSLLISICLLSVVVLVGLWLVSSSPRFWWFWIWCFSLFFSIFITYVSPYVIEPLFNKFTPLDDVDLRENAIRVAAKAGINVSKVLKMDESKRSRHTNAYFTGLGKTKRIVLFDTLLQGMNQDEILAVLAHEIGHWKRRHLVKGMFLFQLLSLVTLFVAYRSAADGFLASLFGIYQDNFFVSLVLFGLLADVAMFFLKPAFNALNRRFENEADRFSCALEGRADAMIAALVKLSRENLSNLYPHPLYVLFHYSHPPVVQRIREIREYCGEKQWRD
jgi:STE24 endopeptidase